VDFMKPEIQCKAERHFKTSKNNISRTCLVSPFLARQSVGLTLRSSDLIVLVLLEVLFDPKGDPGIHTNSRDIIQQPTSCLPDASAVATIRP
jgi:hypothetical protein